MSTSLSGRLGATGSKIPHGYKSGRLQQFTPESMELYKSLFPYVSPGSQLAKQSRGEELGFEPQEEYAKRAFQENLGQLGSRYAELAPGAMSSKRGSGFQNAATQSAQDFALQLSGQRQQLQRQALGDLMGLSSTLLGQQPYQNFLVQKYQKPQQQGFWSKLFGAALPAVGAGIGGGFGGPVGAQLGGMAGSALSSGFRPTQF